jgi:hypothetical protein
VITRALVDRVAGMLTLDARLLYGQAIVESSLEPYAFRYEPAFYRRYVVGNASLSKKWGPLAACSYGALQLMFATALEIGFQGSPEDLFDSETGLYWGARYLALLKTWAHGDMVRALCAYNGGKGAALSQPYRTQAYADKVYAAQERYPLNA